MYCKYCGKEIRNTAKFCPYCGETLVPEADSAASNPPPQQRETQGNDPGSAGSEEGKKTKKCPDCGRIIRAEASFCPYCGSAWKPPAGTAEPPQEETEDGEPPRICPYCGNRIPEHVQVCPFCGDGFPEDEISPQKQKSRSAADLIDDSVRTAENPGNALAGKLVSQFCHSAWFLIFTVLLTAYFLIDFISAADFPALMTVNAVPALLLAVGCWLIYADSRRDHPSPGGFFALTAGLGAAGACFAGFCGFFCIAGVRCICSQGSDSLGELILGVSLLVLVLALWGLNRLWRVSRGARMVRCGTAAQWNSSLTAIILLCGKAVWNLVVLFVWDPVREPIRRALNQLLRVERYANQTASDAFQGLFRYLFERGGLGFAGNLLALALTALAVVLLLEARHTGRKIREAAEILSQNQSCENGFRASEERILRETDGEKETGRK